MSERERERERERVENGNSREKKLFSYQQVPPSGVGPGELPGHSVFGQGGDRNVFEVVVGLGVYAMRTALPVPGLRGRGEQQQEQEGGG